MTRNGSSVMNVISNMMSSDHITACSLRGTIINGQPAMEEYRVFGYTDDCTWIEVHYVGFVLTWTFSLN